MPIQYAISLDLDLVYERWWGHLTLRIFMEHFASFLTDRNFRPGRAELVDLSEVEGFAVDFAEAYTALAAINASTLGNSTPTRTVIWAPNDTTFAAARMYQQLAELQKGTTVEIHRDQADVLAAYDLPFPSITALLAAKTFLPADPLPPPAA